MNENEFYRELDNAPPPAEKIFDRIEKRITIRRRVVRGLFALAACLVLAAGGTLVMWQQGFAPAESTLAATETVNEEVENELQIIYDYLHGNDIADEVQLYSFVDASFYE